MMDGDDPEVVALDDEGCSFPSEGEKGENFSTEHDRVDAGLIGNARYRTCKFSCSCSVVFICRRPLSVRRPWCFCYFQKCVMCEDV